MTKVNIPSMLVSPNSPTPKSTNSIYSLFSLKTPSIKSSLKSPQKSPIKSFKSTTTSSKNEIKYVLNGAKRVLTKFQHFNHHHELCVKCTGFIEQVIKILENVGTLSKNKRDQLIETKEYNDCSTSISEIEYYFKKHNQENSNPSEVKESLKKFVLNLEIVVNAIQRASEHLKTKKGSKWSPSNVSKIKTIGKLMVMKKESDRIKDDGDFVPLTHEEEPVIQQGLNIPTCEVEEPSNIPTSVEDPLNVPTSQKENPIEPVIQREVIIPKSLSREDESPNETIIQQDIIMPTGFIKQELIIPTGLNREGNYEGMFFNNKLSEKCIGIISRDDIKFTKFKDEMSYLMDLSCGCNNILSVKGFTERSIKENPSILIYIVNFLSSFFFNYKNKHATMLVTEWAEFNLPDYLKKNDLDWNAKLSIARGIANALNHIHNLNLLHYNVKSDSVLLDHDLEPKLHKFGKDAKDCVFLKSAGSLKPSNWSAPEVKRGGKYTSASEVYSFGVILWEIATQECLSGNKSIDKRDIVDAPTNYLTIMKSALDQEPQNRPTMQEMFDTLSQLESFYSARQQKQQNLSIRNIINIINTNSAVSSSSEDLTIDSASSRVTSRANSPAPSISDQEYMFFTNNVNITSKVENSTDNDEFTVSESTSSIEKSPTVNADDTEKSSIFTTNNVDYHSDTENSTTIINNVETNAEKSPTSTNDIDYHSDIEISTSTNDVDYHSDTESSTNFTKDVETIAEKSPTSTNNVDYHSDTEILTSTNVVDYHSDTESSTNFIKDVETNAEKSPTSTNDVDYHSDTEIPTSTNDVDYHSDTESSTNFTKDVETNAEKSPTSTIDVDYHSDTEISTSTNDVDYHLDTESSTNFTKDVEANAEKSPTSTNDVDYHSETESSTNFTKDVETNAEKSPTSTNDVDNYSNFFQGTHTYSIIVVKYFKHIHDCNKCQELEKMLIQSDKKVFPMEARDIDTTTSSSVSNNTFVIYHSDTEISTSTNDIDCHSGTESSTNFTKDVETNAEKSPAFTNDVDYHSDTESSTNFTKNVETNADKSPTFTNDVGCHSGTESSTNFSKNVETNADKSPTSTNDVDYHSDTESSISTYNVDYHSGTESSTNFTKNVETNADESPTSTNDVGCHSDIESSTNFTKDVDAIAEKSPPSTNDVDYHSSTEISTFINDCHSGTERYADKSPTSTNNVDYHSDTESSISTNDVGCHLDTESSISTYNVDCHSGTESSTNFTKDVETNADKSPTSTNNVDYHSDTESSISTYNVDYHSDTENSTTITNNVETNAENSPTFTNNVAHNSNIEILPTLTIDIKSTSNIEKSSSTIIHHVESASNAENSPTFTNNIKSTSDTVILTNDVNSASNIENIYLNEFKKLHNNKQYRKAFKLINGYAKLDPKVLFWMGYYHYKGYHESSPYKPDIMTSLKYLEAGAKLNDPDAQYYYSHIIFHCCLNGIENGYEIALKHLKKASEQNHPASMLELGKYMINGKFGCKKDITSGKTLIRRAKELGNRSANSDQKVDGMKARKYQRASNASTSPLKRNVYQRRSRTSSNASSASSIRSMIVSKSFSSKKTNTITMDQT